MCDENRVTETVQELVSGACQTGARVRYRSLRLRRLEWPGSDRWRVERADGQYVDTISIDGFRSASELECWLDRAHEGGPTAGRCLECPRRSLPGD
ncbi:hypothetical protein [Natrinema pallidum]|uniref:hypothetical protein n=1 Tax=Natrinema pallidum TaxID=69527 RepID=UPI001268FE69|nr:hypothetical protein [Natrinema pallidum]